MHGMFLVELRAFCDEFKSDTWRAIHERNGLMMQPYLPIATYPEERFMKLIDALSEEMAKPRERVLDWYGTHLAKKLLTYPGVQIPVEYKTLQVLEHLPELEEAMAKRCEPKARPPLIHTRRTGPVEVTLEYVSPLRLCAMGKGIIRGIAQHFNETITLHEQKCLLLGASSCIIIVRRRGSTTTAFKALKG